MALFQFRESRKLKKKKENVSIQKAATNLVVKAISLIKGVSDERGTFSPSEFDLEEIKIASEQDSYVRMSFMKYSYMFLKAGYILKSDNQKAVDYIKKRLSVMSFATGKPMDILFQEVGDDLIKYSNAFLIKSRVDSVMYGIQAKGLDGKNPIGGYFRVDPATMYITRDKYGTITKYTQYVEGVEKNFQPSEVLHIYMDKEAANAFGTPRIIAALEDVKILRRIEGNIMAMIYRFSMPLFQWIVGLPQTGYQATDKEIAEVKRQVDNMSLDGSIVTNEKTNLKVVGAEGSALNASPYLNYFENRVFAALGVSASQMGRSNSNNADAMEAQAHDTIKYIQKIFSIFIQFGLIDELLLEGGFNPIVNEKDKVKLVFNEISIDTKVKVENHEMAKYQSNMTTFEEMRRDLGLDEKVDESRLYKNMIEINSEKAMSELKTEESIRIMQATKAEELKNSKALAKESTNSNNSELNIQNESDKNKTRSSTGSGSKKVSPNGNGKLKYHGPNNDISNKNTPENQYGKTSVKITESLNPKQHFGEKKSKHKKTFKLIYNKYNNLSNDIIRLTDKDQIDNQISKAINSIMDDIKREMLIASNEAIFNCKKEEKEFNNSTSIANSNISIDLQQFEQIARRDLKKVFTDIKKRVDLTNGSAKEIKSTFSVLEYRIRYILEYIIPKVYWYSYLKTIFSLGYKKAYIDFDGSKDQEKHKSVLTEDFSYHDYPPFHPFCNCQITFEKGDND